MKFTILLLSLFLIVPVARAQYAVSVVADPIAVENHIEDVAKWTQSINFLNFFKSKTGQITGFGILFFVGACLLTGVLYFRHGTTSITSLTAPNLYKTEDKTQKPSTWYSHEPDADFANKHPVEASDGGTATGKSPICAQWSAKVISLR